ncbi:hypothetical protein KIN20_015882 [Parelaphostrongylus tenuis]|uniref:Peptidase A1 domain-containing protein n=1 Tax=Parelaphostrongylus tenuis TaxID=148309 RepID=A0AAD5QMJ6_PARTN|nr:hypothetical protein KIN20_015882 [Parelaphostrongylus tenuis]
MQLCGSDKCAVAFYGYDSGGFGPAWFLGDPLIRTYYKIYAIGQKRIGLAMAIHSEM